MNTLVQAPPYACYANELVTNSDNVRMHYMYLHIFIIMI